MADDYKVQIGINADESKLANIEQRLKAIERPATLTINSNLNQVSTQLSNIETRLRNLRNINMNLNLGGGNGGGNRGGGRNGGGSNNYNDAMYWQRQINSVNAQIAKANPARDISKYQELISLQNTYLTNLTAINRGGFSPRQAAQFDRLRNAGETQVNLIKRGLADNQMNTQDGLANRLVSIQKKISTAQQSVQSLSISPGSHSNEIETLQSQIVSLEQEYQQARTLLQTPLTTSQQNSLASVFDDADAKLEKVNAKIRDYVQSINQKVSNGTIGDQIGRLEEKYSKAGGGAADSEINKNIEKLRGLQSIMGSTVSSDDYTQMSRIIDAQREYVDLLTKTNNLVNEQKRNTQTVATPKDINETIANGITKKLSTGDLDNVVSTLQSQFAKLGSSDTGITANIEHLKQLLSDMGNASGVDELISKYKEFNTLASNTKDQIKGIKDYQNLEFSKKNLSNDIDAWLKKNSAAAMDFGAELKRIQSEIATADGVKLTKLKQEFISVKKEAAAAGKTGLSFVDQMKKLLPAVSAIQVVQRGVEVVKQMATEVVSVDTSMTELKRVTSLSASEYENLYDSMVQSAKKYGAQLDTMINSTASWVRLGFDANTANKLAEVSTMYQHVTDLDEATAVKNLVTAYKGYQDQLLATTNNDSVAAVEKVADIFDKLGNELPVTAAQVGAGMNKWASVAQSAGATIEEAAAMTVGSGSVTQDFDQAGSSLKISTLRIMGMKGALEELGEEVDDDVASISSMQTKILNLTGGAVNIFEKDGKSFRNIFEIFRDIANILPKLDDTDRSQLLETIAGKNRSNSILAMLQNWDEVERALTAANDAAGTAREENDIYMDSIQGKIDSLKASWQALSNTVVDSNILKSGLDFVNGIVDGLDAIVGKIGPIMTIIAGGTAIKSVKSIS